MIKSISIIDTLTNTIYPDCFNVYTMSDDDIYIHFSVVAEKEIKCRVSKSYCKICLTNEPQTVFGKGVNPLISENLRQFLINVDDYERLVAKIHIERKNEFLAEELKLNKI